MAVVRWTAQALQDLQEHLEYLHQQDPRLAANAARQVRRIIRLLQTFPRAGRLDPELGARELWVPKSRIVLVHVLHEDVVEIIAAFHTSRDPRHKPRG